MKLSHAVIMGAGATLLFLFLSSIGWPPMSQEPRGSEGVNQEHAEETALVTFVVDGDTIELENGERVRYIGIDTPEVTHTPFEVPDCYGNEATERNRELVLGKEVILVADTSDRDPYNRLLRYVYVDGEQVNHTLVAEGYARTVFIRPDIRQYSLFKGAEDAARSAGLGLWGACR